MWTAVIGMVVLAVWLLSTGVLIYLILDERRAWASVRERQRQLTEDALKYYYQRQVQQRLRMVVDADRRRQELIAVLHTPRSSRSGEPQ